MLVRGSAAADPRESPAFVLVYGVCAAPIEAGGVQYTGRVAEHEMGFVPLSTTGAELLFEVFS